MCNHFCIDLIYIPETVPGVSCDCQFWKSRDYSENVGKRNVTINIFTNKMASR